MDLALHHALAQCPCEPGCDRHHFLTLHPDHQQKLLEVLRDAYLAEAQDVTQFTNGLTGRLQPCQQLKRCGPNSGWRRSSVNCCGAESSWPQQWSWPEESCI